MIIGIDASNIRAGGGLTHLVELLRVSNPIAHGFSKIIIWSGKNTLNSIADRTWLQKNYFSVLDDSLVNRILWQKFSLSKLALTSGCDVLFVPGGSYTGSFRPMVTMSQNLLPFEWREIRRYGFTLLSVRLILLRWIQSKTFHKADGLIFLTKYARNIVLQKLKKIKGKMTVIPHGIDKRFINAPKKHMPLEHYSIDLPFRILYVSIIDMYKHQWHVADAVVKLRSLGFPIVLDLIGPSYKPALKRLRRMLNLIDPDGKIVRYWGKIPYEKMHTFYNDADLCVFASSCETFGQILIEAMSSGLPIACSDRSAMSELLGDAGVYFDPEKPESIANAIEKLITSPEKRDKNAYLAHERAKKYSWEKCASDTFSFVRLVAET